MENALFYTFSTIAQTLAAGIALLGAFALYRLQAIENSLESLAVTAIQPYLPDDVARKMCADQEYFELIQHLSTTQPKRVAEANEPYQIATRRQLRDAAQLSLSLPKLLKAALALTVIVIVASVVVLSLGPIIAASVVLAKTVFVVGILAFVGCLGSYGLLVQKCVK